MLAMKRTHAELLEARMSVYDGAHRCTLGANGSEGACTPVPRGGGRACLRPEEGHTCLHPVGVGRGSMLGGGISYPLLVCFFTFRGRN
jgi:hypothetical protein